MSNPQHEPTMEEILASIRKIISEDATEPAAEAPKAAEPAPAPKLEAVAAAPVEEDILDLTDEVHEEPAHAPAAHAAPAAVAAHDDIVFEAAEEKPAMSAPQPVLATPAPEPVRHEEPAARDTGLFRDRSRSAFDDALSRIDAETSKPEPVAPPSGPLPNVGNGPALADVVDQAVRKAFDPVLRDWLSHNSSDLLSRIEPVIAELLEKHLPEMLATAVREEMARAKSRR